MRPELWKRYGSHFSPYLLRRIERLKQTARQRVAAQSFIPAS
ncbi:MAG: hypothetical protein U0401_12865 [Anaerolineae bacterium]